MQPNELRIGNLVGDSIVGRGVINSINSNGETTIIRSFSDVYKTTIKRVKPIVLNENWLLKLGFNNGDKYVNTKGQWSINNFKIIEFDWEDIGKVYHLFETPSGNLIYWKHGGIPVIKYVHELQNLYYTLTGEELTFNN